MVFVVTVDRDADGMLIVECPAVPGCVSQGRTEAEAMRNIRMALRECLIVRKQRRIPTTVETRTVEISLR